MQKLYRKEFERIVEEGIKLIPQRFLEKLNNVVIVVEREPNPVQIKKTGHAARLDALWAV